MNSGWLLLAAALAAAFVAALATPAFRRFALAWRILDRPNERSSHQTVIARAGGVVLLAAAGLGLAMAAATWTWSPRVYALLAGLLLVAGVGLWDDRSGVSPWLRLAVHATAALLVVSTVGDGNEPVWLTLRLGAFTLPAALWVVAIVNFYNFLDGIDGLAATQGLITGVGLALAGWDPFVAACGAAVAGGCAGFLVHNWEPASIFMGDVGSGALGFLFASAALLAPRGRGFDAVLFVSLSLWLFIADAVFTLLGRITRGERWYEAHRQHVYQRLVIAGWPHAKVTLLLALWASLLTFAALAAWRQANALWFGGTFALAIVAFAGELILARRSSRPLAIPKNEGRFS